MTDSFALLTDEERRLLRKSTQPGWVSPMKAVLTKDRFSDPEWIFEPKLDGERCLALKAKSQVRLLSRNRKPMNSSYPEIVEALAEQEPANVVLDGEVVAFKGGATSFARLQRRMHVMDPEVARRTGVAVFFYVFDIVFLDGYDLTELPLRARKKLLRKALAFGEPLRFMSHRNEKGEAYFEETCAKPGWEGIIAKRADSPYVQTRSRYWLKFKCANQQEFVVGGFTDPQGSRTGFGALLIGYYDGDRLRYAGKVGTGYDRKTLETLSRLLRSKERAGSPFADRLEVKAAHWVTPSLVAQIGFAEWTGDGKLRHPRFLGLRRDKPAREVVRETPG